MKLDRFIRLAAGLAILAVFIIAVGALLFVTESALNVWDRLREGPVVLLMLYVTLLAGFALAAIYLIWRLVIRREPKAAISRTSSRLDRDSIEQRLKAAESAGVDVSDARRELEDLAGRQQLGQVHLCFFGEVSKGKSSLVRALIPESDVVVDVVGGSTDDIRHHRWRADDGTTVLLTDIPGLGAGDGLKDAAISEARRSQAVLFVCDGDLNRVELDAVQQLLSLDKPLVLVLNKADRFDPEEQASVMQRLLERVESLGGSLQRDRIVAVSAGGETDVIERLPDGSERVSRKTRPADVGVLVVAVQRLLGDDDSRLDLRRDQAVFRLAADRIDEAEGRYRAQRAEQIIRNATRKAVVGSLAAVSPGTDVLIQGYIGTTMTQDLCRLYAAAPRDLDIEEFLDLSQSRVGKALPLTLAVAGNGLKAFPGIGTVAGGVVHAVAYGLIFDALGRSLVLTLNQHGNLVPDEAARAFEEGLSEHIEAGVRRVARMAVDNKKD
ncbi:MAG: GTPase [Pseudomonadota bacterium]